MTYPQAPWTLKGYAVQTVQLLDIAAVRPFIPSELEIVSVWPNKTLGGVYVASYGAGSVLEYSELIVMAGVVNYSGTWGTWISHIYVDHPDSVVGGREIWGLPKHLAEFNWDGNSVTVRQGDKGLCGLSWKQTSLPVPMGLQLPLSLPVISGLDGNFLMFKGDFNARWGLVDSRVTIPPESDFAGLNLDSPWLSVYCDELRLVAGVPEVIGEKSVEFSYQ